MVLVLGGPPSYSSLMTAHSQANPVVTRRPVLGVGLLASTLLVACGDDGATPAAEATSASPAPTSAPQAATGAALVKLADVPVGGAVSAKTADGTDLIIAQPTAGTVAAFIAKCTHKGCAVAPAGDKLDCPCHGSVFEAMTGKNISGPAPSPLVPFGVRIAGDDVVGA